MVFVVVVVVKYCSLTLFLLFRVFCLFVCLGLLANHQSWKTKSLENRLASLCACLVAILVCSG